MLSVSKLSLVNNNDDNNNNNNHDSVYGVVIVTKVIVTVHMGHLMNVD